MHWLCVEYSCVQQTRDLVQDIYLVNELQSKRHAMPQSPLILLNTGEVDVRTLWVATINFTCKNYELDNCMYWLHQVNLCKKLNIVLD